MSRSDDSVAGFYSGDAVEQLEQLPSDSVHTICTSPPYWGHRDYGHAEQIGTEDTASEYLDNLVSVFRACKRVLRDDGSMFVNIDDTYVEKALQGIPARLAQRLSEDVGFICRNKLIWAKEHAKPDPSQDRRSNTHEYVYHFTLSQDYFYDETAVGGDHTTVITAPTATSQMDHLAVYSEALVAELLDGVTPASVCGDCGTPYERRYEEVPRPFADPDRKQSQRAAELYADSSLTEDHLDAIRAVGISDVGKAAVTEDGSGRNADRMQRLARKAKEVLGGYYREFTMVERIPDGWRQSCRCSAPPVGAVVCDPFVGSGTTTAVARRNGHRVVGIDINEQYLTEAKQRSTGVSS